MKALLALLTLLATGTIAAAAPAGSALAAKLAPARQTIAAGTTPKFVLTVTNSSGKAVKVFRIDRRPDWQPVFAPLTVTRDGKPVSVPTMISDPGPVTGHESLPLRPGETMTVAMYWFPELWNELPPGTYEASVNYDPDGDGPRQPSNAVEVVVTAPKPAPSAPAKPAAAPAS